MKQDVNEKYYLNDRKRIADLINGYFFHGIQCIAPEDVEEGGTQLLYQSEAYPLNNSKDSTPVHLEHDLLHKIIHGANYFVFSVEEQNYLDPSMVLRSLDYTVGQYMKQRHEIQKYLWIGQIQMDYKGLVKEKLSGKLGGIAAFLAGEKLEKMALELLWTEESKQKLLEAARNVIEKYGFAIELADVQLMQDKMEIVDAIETAVHLHLTEKMETDILDALAEYLKESVMGQSPVLSEEE